ncbi:SDR family oxidoreductase [Methanolobus sediminis]|uniref:SDR family oxidoreductase n=1 Tax=Methanolobus sediminis TaxID=3072978 RepID=A0AA51UKG7_9EURY|nr:SDR family oxidoreductase [Methanolobus sediminis]WMW25224.1 SDR family oxidoreductase [Methanolobus sediminis]
MTTDNMADENTETCRKTVLITGGAGGIGQEFAKLFARDGYDLLLVDRAKEELKHVRDSLQAINLNMSILLLEQDLTEPDSAEKVHAFTSERGLHIDVLINCAGFGSFGFVNDIDVEKELDMLQLHVITLYRMTRLYLKEMIRHNEGTIINVSSISAFQPNPYFATYGASKSFVLNFSRALNYELKEKGTNVKVLAVCPTAVKDTGFKAAAGMEHTRAFHSWMSVNAKVVARDTYNALGSDRDVVIPGRGLGLLHRVVSFLPVKWLMRISRCELKEGSGIRLKETFICSHDKGTDQ